VISIGNQKSPTPDSGEREALSLSLLDGLLDCPQRAALKVVAD